MKCIICKKSMIEHTEEDLKICSAELRERKQEEDEKRTRQGYDCDSHDGGVFTFDC